MSRTVPTHTSATLTRLLVFSARRVGHLHVDRQVIRARATADRQRQVCDATPVARKSTPVRPARTPVPGGRRRRSVAPSSRAHRPAPSVRAAGTTAAAADCSRRRRSAVRAGWFPAAGVRCLGPPISSASDSGVSMLAVNG